MCVCVCLQYESGTDLALLLVTHLKDKHSPITEDTLGICYLCVCVCGGGGGVAYIHRWVDLNMTLCMCVCV